MSFTLWSLGRIEGMRQDSKRKAQNPTSSNCIGFPRLAAVPPFRLKMKTNENIWNKNWRIKIFYNWCRIAMDCSQNCFFCITIAVVLRNFWANRSDSNVRIRNHKGNCGLAIPLRLRANDGIGKIFDGHQGLTASTAEDRRDRPRGTAGP